PDYREFRVGARRHRAWGSSSVAPVVVDTSCCVTPRGYLSTTPPILAIRYPRRSAHLLPARPYWLAPVHRHGPECPRGTSCRKAGRSGIAVRSSPCDTA